MPRGIEATSVKSARNSGGRGFVVSSCALAIVLACSAPKSADYLVRSAQSPDRLWTALLVRRQFSAALSSDLFFVVVSNKIGDTLQSQWSISSPISSEMEESALVTATRADALRLTWDDSRTLRVICSACGIEAHDIKRRMNTKAPVAVRFEGFPSQLPP